VAVALFVTFGGLPGGRRAASSRRSCCDASRDAPSLVDRSTRRGPPSASCAPPRFIEGYTVDDRLPRAISSSCAPIDLSGARAFRLEIRCLLRSVVSC